MKNLKFDMFSIKTSDHMFQNLLKTLDIQRDIPTNKVKKIYESILTKGYFPHKVITVNKYMKILDGQRRVTALSLHADEGRYYEIVIIKYKHSMIETMFDDESIENQVTILDEAYLSQSSLDEKWKNKDFLSIYCKSGRPVYLKFKEMMDKYKLPWSSLITLMGRTGVYYQKLFEEGRFEFDEWEKVEEAAEKLERLSHVYPYAKNNHFVRAIIKFLNCEFFDFELFLTRVDVNRDLLYRSGTVEQYCTVIQKAYNYRTRAENKVNFLRYFDFAA